MKTAPGTWKIRCLENLELVLFKETSKIPVNFEAQKLQKRHRSFERKESQPFNELTTTETNKCIEIYSKHPRKI